MRAFATDCQRYAFLRDLQDINETLFYALLPQNLEELLPLVSRRRWAKAASASAKSDASRTDCS